MKNAERRVLSLFSGCGGMDIGLEGGFSCLRKSVNEKVHPSWIAEHNGNYVKLAETGFKTVFADDIRPDARAAWNSYFPDRCGVYHLESVVDLVRDARAGNFAFPDKIDVVTGGFPCQSFSVAGKRLGLNDRKDHLGHYIDEPTAENRGMLYMWMRDVVSIVEPKMFIAENVKGLTNLGDVKQVIEHDFAKAGGDGYVVVPAKVLYAADYGVPQSRERVIFFGFRKRDLKPEALAALSSDEIPTEYDPYPVASFSKDGADDLRPYVTCADAFVDLQEPENSSDPAQKAYSKAKYMGKHCQGQSEVRLDGVGPTIRAEHHGNIEYRRLSAELGGTHADELAAGMRQRRLTIRECARIQTFPDNYKFITPKTKNEKAVSSSDAYKIIGNAVPPVLAYNIAQRLNENWEKYFKEA